jgi:hypothetical protein
MSRRQAATRNVTRHPSVDPQSGSRRQPITMVGPTGGGVHDHAPRPGPPSPWRHAHARLASAFRLAIRTPSKTLRQARDRYRRKAAVIRIAGQAGSARISPTDDAAGAQGRRWRNRAGLADTGADCTGGVARDQASVSTATEHEVLLTAPSRCAVVRHLLLSRRNASAAAGEGGGGWAVAKKRVFDDRMDHWRPSARWRPADAAPPSGKPVPRGGSWAGFEGGSRASVQRGPVGRATNVVQGVFPSSVRRFAVGTVRQRIHGVSCHRRVLAGALAGVKPAGRTRWGCTEFIYRFVPSGTRTPPGAVVLGEHPPPRDGNGFSARVAGRRGAVVTGTVDVRTLCATHRAPVRPNHPTAGPWVKKSDCMRMYVCWGSQQRALHWLQRSGDCLGRRLAHRARIARADG